MTEANQKILYDHFIKVGRKADAEDILKSYPHFKEVKEEPKPKKVK